MRIGLYGGSFDPIHWGHLEPVRKALEEFSLDRVFFLPTARPPHKRDQRLAPALARFAMAELALIGESKFYVSSMEMERDGPSYTVETLERCRQERPEVDWYLLIGSDSFLQLPTWHRWREIPELATLGVMPRPGATFDPAALENHELGSLIDRGKALLVSEPATLQISSTRIRKSVAEGRKSEIEGELPGLVLDYIVKYDLYR